MKICFLFTTLFLISCTSSDIKNQVSTIGKDAIMTTVTNKDMSYDPRLCPQIKNNCRDGSYTEWLQENDKLACACN